MHHINNNDIYTETRSYPPARIFTNHITIISGYNYGNGKYEVTESSHNYVGTGIDIQTLYTDLELMRNDLLTYSYTQVNDIREVLETKYGYRLIATPTYNEIAERLSYQNANITNSIQDIKNEGVPTLSTVMNNNGDKYPENEEENSNESERKEIKVVG